HSSNSFRPIRDESPFFAGYDEASSSSPASPLPFVTPITTSAMASGCVFVNDHHQCSAHLLGMEPSADVRLMPSTYLPHSNYLWSENLQVNGVPMLMDIRNKETYFHLISTFLSSYIHNQI
ncbi:unnamed protein product, partial [Protopolystoma xenopodis]